jgi:hypothetical protein
LLEDAQLNLLIGNALRYSLDFANLIREGSSQDSFYWDESEWTKENRIETRVGYFWRLYRLYVPRNSKLRLRLICTTVRQVVTKELLALVLKRSTDFGETEFAKM